MKKQFYLLSIVTGLITTSMYAQQWKPQPVILKSRWAAKVNVQSPLNEYPRPQLVRNNWINLNGLWDYAITDTTGNKNNFPSKWDGKILVPFAPESSLSGVGKIVLPSQYLWYKRTIQIPGIKNGERVLLHFGAVDQITIVFVNGREVGKHVGGYTAFTIDITDALKAGNNELLLKVYDATDYGRNPKGKQTLRPQNIYYTSTSGIWQTVWLETVPQQFISKLEISPDIDQEQVLVKPFANENLPAMVKVFSNGKIIATATGSTNEIIAIPVKKAKTWSPESPFLYKLEVNILNNGKITDKVKSYFGMRKISVAKDDKGIERIFLNNKPYYNLGVLDQGFWPEGLYTAPTDEALAYDIKVIKAMGFNTIRKHIKVEPERWYYYADKIGMLVWQDMVNSQGPEPVANAAFEKESAETLAQLQAHPCITTWVLFNERWGSYNQQRLTEWMKKADPLRIVNGHSGEYLYVNDQLREQSENPYVSSDMTDVHAYPDPRMPMKLPGRAMVLGEFGGVGVSVPYHQWDDLQGWGYVQAKPKELEDKYEIMTKRLIKLKQEGLSGSIYTQPFDVEGEENGLLTYDREYIKIPIERIRQINSTLNPASPVSFPTKNLAKNIDVNDNDDRFSELMKQYEAGKKDSAFLRRLALMAMRKKDQPALTEVNNSYIEQMKAPFTKANLEYICKTTFDTRDKGFEMAMNDSAEITAVLGRNSSLSIIHSVIKKQYVEPMLAADPGNPDWNSLRARVEKECGTVGFEFISGEAMIYYLDKQQWEPFSQYYFDYFTTAMSRSDYHINNTTWPIFEHVSDKKVLVFAIKVMEYDITHFDRNSFESIDTYANLLYKSGRNQEALEWEEKAVKLSNNMKELVETLEKMKKGIPTWQ